ncbi:helix-turn-helix transcriptional regulator [Streptomyces sp. NPDC004232]|uniref:helix-turn-helix domain-containing protein n=1 Tax=Streptomyces sp. NPDC004232 TaxID=3154454 RepID=UPI0033B9420B
MQWNLRMKAAEAGIWQASQMRRRLAEAGLEISAGKMSMLWSRTPTTIRLDDLEVLCAVLDCTPCDLLVPTGNVSAREAQPPTRATSEAPGNPPPVVPRPGRPRSRPPL